MDRQAVITGIGIVSPLGIGIETFSRRLFGGESGIAEIASFDTSCFLSHLGAEVKGFSPRDFMSVKNLRKMDRLSTMAVAAASMSLEDAGIVVDAGNRDRVGIILGTSFGPTNISVHFARTLINEGPGFVNPILVPNTVLNAPAGHASIELGFRGINSTVTQFGTSAESAIAYAAAEIRRGAADVMLAGGGDIISEFFYETLYRFKSLSPTDEGKEGAKPFDMKRNGMVAGENSTIICIEPKEQAQARGARIYCEICGWGMGSSPSTPSNWSDDATGVVRTVNRSLKHAGIIPEDIDAIAACANGGQNPDKIEAEAYKKIFGAVQKQPAVFSCKGAIGESFSAGGSNAAAMALAIREGKIPPTLGLDSPIVSLPFATGKHLDLCYGLVSGISFGGTYVTLVLKRGE